MSEFCMGVRGVHVSPLFIFLVCFVSNICLLPHPITFLWISDSHHRLFRVFMYLFACAYKDSKHARSPCFHNYEKLYFHAHKRTKIYFFYFNLTKQFNLSLPSSYLRKLTFSSSSITKLETLFFFNNLAIMKLHWTLLSPNLPTQILLQKP